MKSEDFDILTYLQNRNIPYQTSGDNVSSGWVGINCVFCIDHSDHLGINLHSKAFSCLKCGEKGSAAKLIQAIDGVNLAIALKTMKQFGGGEYAAREKHFQSKVQLPPGSSKKFSDIHMAFLEKRRFTPDVIEKYGLYATGPISGRFKHRIIIPVYMNKRMLCYVGRDITGESDLPYRNSHESVSIKDVKQCLYNMDNVPRKSVVIVEGIFDAWRIGNGAVATFGTRYTHEQLLLLRGMHRAFVLFDADAIPLAHKLAHDLSAIVKCVEVLELSTGDPDEMSDDDVSLLRRELNL
jgi:DNA primase